MVEKVLVVQNHVVDDALILKEVELVVADYTFYKLALVGYWILMMLKKKTVMEIEHSVEMLIL